MSVDNLATLRARFGMPIERLMPYVTAGAVIGTGRLVSNYPPEFEDSHAVHFGVAAGVGLEALVTSNLSVRAEYLVVRLDDAAYRVVGSAQPSIVHHDLTTWRASARWRF